MVPPFVALLVACGGGAAPADAGPPSDAQTVDGAIGDGGPDMLPSGAMVAAPMLPAPPVLTPCPDGWRTVMTAPDAPAVCEPWPESGYQSCPAGQAHLPGTPGCAEVGDPCPSGTFRDDFPAGAHVLYVQAGAPSGGDGTEAMPFATIADATAVATPGTIITLSAGDYDEAVELGQGVELRGACVAQTHLTLTAPGSAAATITLRSPNTGVRDVFISGAKDGIDVDRGASGAIEGVAIEHSTRVALEVQDGSTATIDDVVMRDTDVDPVDRITAWGISVDTGATAVASHVAIERCGYAAAGADAPGSRLTLSDSVVSHPLATVDVVATGHTSGYGIEVGDSATVDLDSVVVEHATYAALFALRSGQINGTSVLVRDVGPLDGEDIPGLGVEAHGSGTVHLDRSRLTGCEVAAALADGSTADVELTDSILEDTVASPMGHAGSAAEALVGGTTSLTRVLIRDVVGTGLQALQANSHFDLTDVSIENVSPEPFDGLGGNGMYVGVSASASIARVLVDGGLQGGLRVEGVGTVTGTDLTIRNIAPAVGPYFKGLGYGIEVWTGSHVDLTRVNISRASGFGLMLSDAMTDVKLQDLRLEGTQPSSTDFSFADQTRIGIGAQVQSGVHTDIERAVLADNLGVALLVSDSGTRLTLGDAVVRDTGSEVVSNAGGDGLQIGGGAQVMVAGARFERNRNVAVAAYDMGTDVTLSDVDILDTKENACAADTCADTSAGFGLVSARGAAVTATRFLVTRSALCGVQVAGGSGLDLTEGEVSHNVIGANVQVPGFDVNRISDHVVYQGNQSNLDTDTLPVPEPTAGVPLMAPPTM